MNTKQKIKDKQLKIELLEGAYMLIEAEEYEFICFALFDVAEKMKSKVRYKRNKDELITYIENALSPYSIYSFWLRENGICKSLLEGRLEWIKWMIACLEEDIEALQNN